MNQLDCCGVPYSFPTSPIGSAAVVMWASYGLSSTSCNFLAHALVLGYSRWVDPLTPHSPLVKHSNPL